MIWVVSPAVAAGQAVNDISGHWAEAAVNRWVDREIVEGYSDGSFKPDAPVKRAEFAALINRIFGHTSLALAEFTDITGREWFASDIAKAVAAGVMNGYPDGTFKPNADISRQEAAVVLARVIGLKDDGSSLPFTDHNSIPAWSRPAVAAATKAGLISGYPDGSFRPTAGITRAETVAILDRFAAELIREEGTYGNAAEQTVVEGSVIILAKDTELINYHIKGDLYIAESVGESAVTLDGVIIDGNLVVKGGGADSVVIKESTIRNLIVDKDGVRVAIQDGTQVVEAYIMSPAKIEQSDDGKGIESLFIEHSDGEIVLSGSFGRISINSETGKVTLESGRVENLVIESTAENVIVEVASNASVTNAVVNAPATISGTGSIENAKITASGAVIEQQPANLELDDGVTATVGGKEVTGTPSEPEPVPGPGPGDTPGGPVEVSAVSVEGDAKVGETLTAKVTPDKATVRYQWQIAEANGEGPGDEDFVNIDDATAKTYIPDGEDIGKYIRVVVEGYGSYQGTKTSDAVGPVAIPDKTVYKLSYEGLADAYVVGELIDTEGKDQVAINAEVEQLVESLTPVLVRISPDIVGTTGYDHVRIAPVKAGEHIQFWAQDTDGNWYDINVAGWGTGGGFPLGPDYDVATPIYILSNEAGTYNLTVQLVDVGNDNEFIAGVSGTVVVREKEHSEYGFEIDDDIQIIAVQELPVENQISVGDVDSGEPGTVPEAAKAALKNAFNGEDIDLDSALVNVIFKAIEPYKELGYEKVRILPLEVKLDGEDAKNHLQAWMYAAVQDKAWFDLVQTGWGTPGTGFSQQADESSPMQVYVFADTPGIYTVTFTAVDTSDPSNETVIATGTTTVEVISREVVEAIKAAKAAIKPSWAVDKVEPVDDEALPGGVENADYKVTIKTSYENKEAAQASGRTVTTLFTVPDGVTVWYPVWEEGKLTYKSASSGEVALGMVGHPLSAENIDADGIVYVALGETTETKFTVTIKLVDADEDWQDVVYGEQELEIKVPEVSEYGFEFEDNIEIIAGNYLLQESEYESNDGTELGELTVSDLTPTTVTLKTTIEKELGYKKVRILPLKVDGPADSSLQVWIYDSEDGKWYDMVQKGWGNQGTGFTLDAKENKEMTVYVFADTPGTYTVTFKAVDTSNPDNEIEIAVGSTAIFAPFYFDAGTGTISSYVGDKENITIPAAVNGIPVKAIGEKTFERNQSIKTVTFAVGSQLETIGDYAFNECGNLESIDIPASVTSIGEVAFRCCYALTSINIPENVTSIEGYTFYACENLISITIPGVKEIKTFALSSTALESITIPDDCTLGYQALSYNNSLTTIFMGNNIYVDPYALFVGNEELGDRGFKAAYKSGGAGTYVLQGGEWKKQQL
jgi:hypothetical protein